MFFRAGMLIKPSLKKSQHGCSFRLHWWNSIRWFRRYVMKGFVVNNQRSPKLSMWDWLSHLIATPSARSIIFWPFWVPLTLLDFLSKPLSFLFLLFNKLFYYLGCPIQELWKHLEERRPPFPFKLDDRAKQFLWKAIVRTLDIEFFALAEPFPHIFGTKQGERTDNESAHHQAQNPLDQVFELNATCFAPNRVCTHTVCTPGLIINFLIWVRLHLQWIKEWEINMFCVISFIMPKMLSFLLGTRKINFLLLIASWVDMGVNSLGCGTSGYLLAIFRCAIYRTLIKA